MVNAAAAGGGKGFLSLALKDKAHLHQSWMPFLRQGGMFVPTNRRFALGDEVFLVLTLPESSERIPVPGKVAWVTPIAALGGADQLALSLQREPGGWGTIADGGHGYAVLTSIRRGRSCSGFGILTVRTPSRRSASMCSASASPGRVMW